MLNLQNPIHVMGLEVRTTNENGRSFMEIPPLWERFINDNCAEKIANKIDHDIYVVYTNFENEGENNFGMYSCFIGCAVEANIIPSSEFSSVVIPKSNYRIFPIEQGRPDTVGPAWQAIWAMPDSEKKTWSFKCEFERYHASGEIDIYIGLRD